jgi:hypothetical protein
MPTPGGQRWSDRDVMQHQTMRAVFESLPGDGYFVQVPKMFHLNLTDVPLLIYAPFGRRLGLFGPIDADRVHRVVNAYTLAVRPSPQRCAGNAARWTSSAIPRSALSTTP